MSTKTYVFARGDEKGHAWFQGRLYKIGETVELTDAQAKYALMDGMLQEGTKVKEAKKPAPAPQPEPEPEVVVEEAVEDMGQDDEMSEMSDDDSSDDEPRRGRRKRK